MLTMELLPAERTFEQTLARHCAPALMGVKPANLFTWLGSAEEIRRLTALYVSSLEHTELRFHLFPRRSGSVLVLAYRRGCLERQLARPGVREMLANCGYPRQGGLDEMLRHLETRLSDAGAFPHEVGLFLGYPLEDVEGFCKHGGQRFKCCGLWKVYSDVRRAQRCFHRYHRCCRTLCRRLESGDRLYQALLELPAR